jgi:putative endonuclease
VSRARVILGKTGEDLACEELQRRGYVILARRYRRRGGELDIVCFDEATVVFVEVKTREGSQFGEAFEAIDRRKRRRMAGIALDYIARHSLADRPCRFDVVSIRFDGDEPVIEILKNAFSLDC